MRQVLRASDTRTSITDSNGNGLCEHGLAMQEYAPAVSVPRLGTRRLNLREYRESDFDAFAAHCADPQAMVHWGERERVL